MTKKIESYQTQVQTGTLLNANESTANLSDEIINEIKDAIGDIEFNRYPDSDQVELRQAYAKMMGVKIEQVLAGNGSDQMLGLLIGTFLGKDKSLYTFDPDFSMYDYYASAYEANVIKYHTSPEENFDVDAFIAEGKEKKISMVMFSNPNNPSGVCLSIEEIGKIVRSYPDIPVVIDEAYFEFSDEVSALTLLEEYDNLYVTRTLSKAYGLAGARLGFLISSEKNMSQILPTAVPYALNRISMKIGCIVLAHASEIQKSIQETKQRRNAMYEKVKNLKSICFYPSQANFLYGKCEQKDALLELFTKENIVIRNYKGKKTFRITIGNEEENKRVCKVLQEYEEAFA